DDHTNPKRKRGPIHLAYASGWCDRPSEDDGLKNRPTILGPDMDSPRTITWIGDTDGFVRLIDQTLLPTRLEFRDCRTVEEIWEAIRNLRVRGAPATGVAAAMGVVLGMQSLEDRTRGAYWHRLREVTAYLRTSRPTAVNLFWALDRMERCVQGRTEELSPEQLT